MAKHFVLSKKALIIEGIEDHTTENISAEDSISSL
jgi:hypothetical protein